MIEMVKGKIVPEIVQKTSDTFSQIYNPDVLLCLANLSNDEVFTPPEVVNQMLDTLPQELFKDPNTKFLDPACKSGVFLREIAKRLIKGLENKMPDIQERLDHIYKEQIYGIAITELTSLLSRRSVYCSKYPNGPFSISHFDNVEGNIRFKNYKHEWEGTPNMYTFDHGKKVRVWRKCKWCGTSEEQLGEESRKGLEYHAYEFIHTLRPEEIFNMKFDVICSNPPYQLATAGDENGAQAKPLYHKFVEQALKLNPKYLTMIIPSRWFAGGWGLDDFRSHMINDKHIRELHDYINASDCFPGVEIKGGVCYFLWDREANGDCRVVTHRGDEIISDDIRPLKEPGCDILIRYNKAIPILHKIRHMEETTFDTIVSTKKPFGFITNYKGAHKEKQNGDIKLYANRRVEYVKPIEVSRNKDAVNRPKVIVPKAVGSGNASTDVIKPLYCEPGSVCTETYLLVGPFQSKLEAENVIEYIGTKFFHFLVTLQKNTQDCMKKVYSFVPLQDFSQKWTDEVLYKKYGLTEDEIKYIEESIWPEK